MGPGIWSQYCLLIAFKSSRSISEKSLEYSPGATLWPCLLRFMSPAHLPSSLSCFMTLEENFSLWSLSILRLLKDGYLPTPGMDEVGRRGEVVV